MVCSKCQKLTKKTALATPDVKKKSEIYHGSSAASKGAEKGGTTLASSGISKVRTAQLIRMRTGAWSNRASSQSKLLSKSAKNPYAQYSSSCTKCKTKVSQGYSYCQSCAYQKDCELGRSLLHTIRVAC